jgi:hypothetical protein
VVVDHEIRLGHVSRLKVFVRVFGFCILSITQAGLLCLYKVSLYSNATSAEKRGVYM